LESNDLDGELFDGEGCSSQYTGIQHRSET
jgi:hypothetical protein